MNEPSVNYVNYINQDNIAFFQTAITRMSDELAQKRKNTLHSMFSCLGIGEQELLVDVFAA